MESRASTPWGQRDSPVRWSDSVPANTAMHENVSFPPFCRKNCRAVIISIVFSVILSLVLVTYLCISRRGPRMSNSPHIRRLASSDEDEACKDFSWLIGTDDEVDDLFSWSPSEFFHGGSLAEQTSSTQTGHRNNQGEGVMQSTVPLPRRTQDVAQGFQVSSDFALSSSWEPSSAQQYAVRTQNFQSAGGLLSYEPTMSSVAQEFETRLYGAEHMQGLHLLEDASAEDMGFPDGHLGLVSASSTEGNLEQSDYTRQVFNEERELLQDSGFLGGSSSRKRGHGTDDTAEYVGHLKKPLNNKETKNLAEGLQGHSDPLLGSAETYPAQPQGIYPQESLFSWDSQSPEEAHTLSATEESGTMSHDHGPMAGLDSLDEKLEKEPFLEQWFFDYILDPSLNSPKSSVELSENAHQLVSELMANAADEGTSSSSPAPEGQSFAADGSSSGDSQLPASEVQDLPGPQEPAAGSPELDSTAGQEGRPSSTAQHNPEFKDSPLQTAADEEALREHPFFRLPNAEFSELTPFDLARATMYARRTSLPDLLSSVRRLLIKRQLGPEDLQTLVVLAEKLVKHVYTMGNFSQSVLPLGELCEPIVRRFLMADVLWSICQVVGPPMRKQEWWFPVMDKLLSLPNATVTWRAMQTNRFEVLKRMLAALHIYREGNRPPAREVVELKREIFFSPSSPPLFRSPIFDPFRDDDAAQ